MLPSCIKLPCQSKPEEPFTFKIVSPHRHVGGFSIDNPEAHKAMVEKYRKAKQDLNPKLKALNDLENEMNKKGFTLDFFTNKIYPGKKFEDLSEEDKVSTKEERIYAYEQMKVENPCLNFSGPQIPRISEIERSNIELVHIKDDDPLVLSSRTKNGAIAWSGPVVAQPKDLVSSNKK